MRGSARWYPIATSIAQHLPQVRPSQQRGLALWVYGTLLAQSALIGNAKMEGG